MDTSSRIPNSYKTIAVWIERLLALAILGGGSRVQSAQHADSGRHGLALPETFYELIYRVLLLVIGIELVRTLVTHDLRSILELLAVVVARKLLKPDLAVLDILLSVLAFVALLAANHFWLSPSLPPEGKEPGNTP